MHSQCSENYGHFKACRAYETAFALKEEGKVRHVGISFHGRPELLEQIHARLLEPADVVRVVDDAHAIGFIVLDFVLTGVHKNTSLLEESELRSFWIASLFFDVKEYLDRS